MLSRHEVEAELQKLKDERRRQVASNGQKQSYSPALTRSEMEDSLKRMRTERQRQNMHYVSAAKDINYSARFGVVFEKPIDNDEINDQIFQQQMSRKVQA